MSTTGSREKALPPRRRFIICSVSVDQSFDGMKQSIRLCLEQDFDAPIGGDHILAMPVTEHEVALSQARAEARASAFEEARKEVSAWRDLIEIDHRDIIAKGQYADPQEAGREYRNKQNLLGAVETGIKKLAARSSAGAATPKEPT